ncbi:UDP-N-acetylmuramoyl-tripeptide--D-alanyl-D-alanine ligase [Paenibacillus psychroresistens]|uniref:UDP-N-acetylmuramoyl-tripeptide--D-alanyl-D-alanine ligase n=1 Tax=Paenibacillus psychroresistens TaxID=1778678 RepID=A0A6B8RJI7_9BACL|nr:UDP-N-acetylmuramoyl-tripeptide--D-alanyl-D-alanine ligase [Paenibacillus psychroresistens]QGQ95775.1 UDP-N-acetylmuramoyl-tripeptide--D-alanyl-D-alanine ligase [Paenibacillus psychroresistens]
MIKRSLEYMIQVLNGEIAGDWSTSLQFHGVSTDTRTLQPGNLFIPLDIGDRYDGHQFVLDAFAKGAVAALWQKDRPDAPTNVPIIYVEDTLISLQELAKAYRLELSVRVIGITGSNGKTTTKDIVAAIMATTYKVHKTKGNLNNHIGLPLTLLQLSEETEMAIIEMGMSERGEIELLSKLAAPDVAIISNIGESHLLQLGSRDEIAKAKLEILAGLRENGLFVYNGDEPLIERFLPEMKQPANILRFRFGSDDSNDFYPVVILSEQEGSYFQINIEKSPNFYLPVLGHHNVINALSAIAVAKYMGVSDADLVKGLRSLEMTSMRIERVIAANKALILNDAYNASPTSMRAAIRLLEEMKGYTRKFVVLGDMLELGTEEIAFHEGIGHELQPQHIDFIFTYGTLAQYIAEAARTRFSAKQVHWFTDKAEMIRQLQGKVSEGDLVLVKGSRGMKLEEVVNALKEGVQ